MIERYTTPEMKILWSETRRYQVWLRVELAATEAWEDLGEVPSGTAKRVRDTLQNQPLDDVFAERVAEIEAQTRHDIVAFTRALTERVGDEAKYIHKGLTSTDVVDTAQNLVLREAVEIVLGDVHALQEVIKEKAVEYKHMPTIGRTHGIHAEPMTFGLKFLNFYAALSKGPPAFGTGKRDCERGDALRLRRHLRHVPPEVEEKVAERLNLSVDPVTNQTVARDRHAELMSALAILGTSLERIAVEIRHLQRTEVREAQEGFAKGQTGSSSMPHKKNPIATENISGLARLMRLEPASGFRKRHPVARARHLALVGGARYLTRHDNPSELRHAPFDADRKGLIVYPENMRKT